MGVNRQDGACAILPVHSHLLFHKASGTGTDNDVIQVARAGVATGLLGIPCRYLHTASEIASLKDIDEVAELLTRFVLALDEGTNVIP
jgi:endoglucanase